MGKSLLRCWLLLLALSIFLVGCGGTGSKTESRNSTLQFSLDWPERSRSVPVLAESVLVVLTQGPTELARTILNRPLGDSPSTGTHNFIGLPPGTVTITITAYLEADGAGSVLATGTSTATLEKGVSTPQAATMNSTVATLELTQSVSSVTVGTPVTVALSAKNSDGAIILLKSGDLQESVTWSSDTTSVANVEGTSLGATVSTLTPGTSEISAHFGSVSGSTTVTVTAPPTTTTRFTMPWTFTGGDAPSSWQSVKVVLKSGETQVSSRTINRGGETNQVTFEDLTIGGNYSIAYSVYSTAGAEGDVLLEDIGTIEASGEPTSYTFASAPFHAAPVSLALSAGASDSYFYVGNSYIMLDYYGGSTGGGQLVATATLTDGTTADVASSVTWTYTGDSRVSVTNAGYISTTNYGGYGMLDFSYKGITGTRAVYSGI